MQKKKIVQSFYNYKMYCYPRGSVYYRQRDYKHKAYDHYRFYFTRYFKRQHDRIPYGTAEYFRIYR